MKKKMPLKCLKLTRNTKKVQEMQNKNYVLELVDEQITFCA